MDKRDSIESLLFLCHSENMPGIPVFKIQKAGHILYHAGRMWYNKARRDARLQNNNDTERIQI